IEPHCQRDPTAFRVDLQHFDTDDIARLRNFARVLDVNIGHRRDVHQPLLVDSDIDEGAERGDVRHDTLKNHAGLQILELSTPSRKLTVLKTGRGSRPGFSSSRKMSVTVGTPNTASVNASGRSWRSTAASPINLSNGLLVAARTRRTTA